MPIDSTMRRISGVQREIESLQSRLTQKTRDLASKSSRIAATSRSITATTSAATAQSKSRDIQRLQDESARIQTEIATLNKSLADKTAQLHKCQQDLYKEQNREQKQVLDAIHARTQERRLEQRQLVQRVRLAESPRVDSADSLIYDAFISHASENKDEIVRPLAEALTRAGLRIWYDESELRVGDSLRRSIDRGLSQSRFGIVVLSPAFFAKNWPQYELDGLVAKESVKGRVILPLWHKVSKDEVMRYSPTLADRVALLTAMSTIDEIAQELSRAMKEA